MLVIVSAVKVCQLTINVFVTVDHYKQDEIKHQNDSIKYELSFVLGILSHTINMFDSISILWGVCYFYNNQKWKGDQELGIPMIAKMIAFVFIIVECVVSFIPPIVLSRWWKETPPYNKQTYFKLGLVNLILEWIDHTYNFVVRLCMIIATVMVRKSWCTAKLRLDRREQSSAQETPTAKDKFQGLADEYNTTGESVASVQRLFQAWFIVKWLTYFTDIIVHSANAWIQFSNGTTHNDVFYFNLTHLFYDIVAFTSIYACASIMNYYHDDFYSYLMMKQREYLKYDKEHWIDQDCEKIRKKYRFVPSLCLIVIPIDNSGYTITILLSLFAFIFDFRALNYK